MQEEKTYYLKQGSTFWVTDNQNINIHDKLPAKTFVVLHDPMKGFFLSQVANMNTPNKVYGNTVNHVGRIFTTFSQRDRNTGILLNGEKGAGKTLTLSLLANKFMSQGLPVLIINSAFYGDQFNSFITGISQPCMVAFDEFDKTYKDDEQTQILTLLDGVFNNSKLFVFTCNQSWKINSFLLNRPGRIFYNLSYTRLEENAIREYCEDVLVNKKNTDGVIKISNTIDAFNFDMLKALIEEMNRFDETASDSIKLLNIRPERKNTITYLYKIKSKNGLNLLSRTDILHENINPLNGKPFTVNAYSINPEYDEKNDNYDEEYITHEITLTPKECVKLDSKEYIFEKDDFVVTITKEHNETHSYPDYF